VGRLSPVAAAAAVTEPAPATDAGRRLLLAGRRLMQERRSTDFTMQDVAERARTSLRTLYEHFGNRDDFVLAVFEDAIAEAAGPLRDAVTVAAAGDAAAQLRAYIEHLFEATFTDEHPEMPALIALHMDLARTNPSALARVLAPQQAVLVELVDRGVEAGTFRTDVEPGALAMLVSLTLIGTLHTNALGSHLGSEVDAEALVRFCLAAVGAGPALATQPGGRP
jgi:AcrR family transcriptional regulator